MADHAAGASANERNRYPAHREADVVLRDGSTVHIRPARPDDRERIEDFLIGLSEESLRLRFWGLTVDITDVATKAVDIDYVDHLTLLAVESGSVIGGAQYVRLGAVPRAEVSVSIADAQQGRGLGSILIAHLAEAAHANGIDTFTAAVLPENHKMIEVFRRTGFAVRIRAVPGEVEVELSTEITEEAAERYEEREDAAAAAAMRTLLQPSAVAVIGASRDPTSIGGRLLHNLLSGPFQGVVYPVNPKASAVQGVTAYPTVTDVRGDVDVAIVAVPATSVIDVARGCADKGVRGLVVISSGFGETGEAGLDRQRELLDVCRASGMRLVGPNCMGLVNTDPAYLFNGTFSTAWPPTGRMGFLSQSGALGIAVMAGASELGLGMSTFVSVGNKADVSGNDLLCYWEQDERTELLLLYLESFGNPRRFGRLARRIGRTKPIVAVKSGRSAAGRRAASSHTGALLAASDTTIDALFRQHGVIRTDTLEEMFDVATLLANQPVPGGDRVAIVTNAGGLGIQCADTCEANGLTVPQLSAETVSALRSFLPDEASVSNPVDMIASASPEDYGRAIGTAASDPGIDALIAIYIPPVEDDAPAIAAAMVEAFDAIGGRIPVLTCFMSARGLPDALRAPGVRVPSFPYPEQAAIALAHAMKLGVWRARPEGTSISIDAREDEAAAVIADALTRDEDWLTPDEVRTVLGCYGVPTPRQATVGTPEEAAAVAASFPGSIALKAIGPLHKTDVGAVSLGLDPAGVEAEVGSMSERVLGAGQPLEGFLIQQMVPPGVEMLVGAVADPSFGPVIAVSAGGATVELTRDVGVRVAPLTDLDADEMIRSLATFPLLDGFRGAPKADVAALRDVVLRIGAMATTHEAIAELDCNPVIVHPEGAVVVDARISVRPPRPVAPFAARTRD
ncbi:MAG TPA: GNAT family N-acetyltransferase [Actinomycetota bacterium]|nr:GNAT family N-acetyltransferase [Actinomycetota bacterium]